jgi:hypothetical protein
MNVEYVRATPPIPPVEKIVFSLDPRELCLLSVLVYDSLTGSGFLRPLMTAAVNKAFQETFKQNLGALHEKNPPGPTTERANWLWRLVSGSTS